MQHICLPIDVFKSLKEFHIGRKSAQMWIHVDAQSEEYLQWSTQIVLAAHFPTAFFCLLSCVITFPNLELVISEAM